MLIYLNVLEIKQLGLLFHLIVMSLLKDNTCFIFLVNKGDQKVLMKVSDLCYLFQMRHAFSA